MLPEVIVLPSIKEITVLTCESAGIAWRVCAPEMLGSMAGKAGEHPLSYLWPWPRALDSV